VAEPSRRSRPVDAHPTHRIDGIETPDEMINEAMQAFERLLRTRPTGIYDRLSWLGGLIGPTLQA